MPFSWWVDCARLVFVGNKSLLDELMETGSQAAVSFALTCPSLEELALGSLWGKQMSLSILARVGLSCTWVKDEYGIEVIVSGLNFPVTLKYRRDYDAPLERAS